MDYSAYPGCALLPSVVVGSRVALVLVSSGRVAEVVPGMLFASYVDDRVVRVARRDAPARVVCAYSRITGKTTVGLASQDVFLSGNPAHVAEAERLQNICDAQAARARAERERRIAIAAPVGDELAGGGEDAMAIATILADRLTDEQLFTLSGWLGRRDANQPTTIFPAA